jgi:hypothetical protein
MFEIVKIVIVKIVVVEIVEIVIAEIAIVNGTLKKSRILRISRWQKRGGNRALHGPHGWGGQFATCL